MEHVSDFESFLNEGKIQVKRKYTDMHPEHSVSDIAPVRERVISFIKEKGKATHEEILEFFKTLNEKTGGRTSAKWLSKNSNYFTIREKNDVKTYTLSKLGERVYYAMQKRLSESVNEAREIEKLSKEFIQIVNQMKDTVDDWKKATGEEKDSLLSKLKELTAKKKELEKKLNQEVSDKDRNVELIISEE